MRQIIGRMAHMAVSSVFWKWLELVAHCQRQRETDAERKSREAAEGALALQRERSDEFAGQLAELSNSQLAARQEIEEALSQAVRPALSPARGI